MDTEGINVAMCPTARKCVTFIPVITSDVIRPIRLISGHNMKQNDPSCVTQFTHAVLNMVVYPNTNRILRRRVWVGMWKRLVHLNEW